MLPYEKIISFPKERKERKEREERKEKKKKEEKKDQLISRADCVWIVSFRLVLLEQIRVYTKFTVFPEPPFLPWEAVLSPGADAPTRISDPLGAERDPSCF